MSEEFDGVPGSRCEHRSVGRRAWCLGCQEWCYPHDPCSRCVLVQATAGMRDIRACAAAIGDCLYSEQPDMARVRAMSRDLADRITLLADELGLGRASR